MLKIQHENISSKMTPKVITVANVTIKEKPKKRMTLKQLFFLKSLNK